MKTHQVVIALKLKHCVINAVQKPAKKPGKTCFLKSSNCCIWVPARSAKNRTILKVKDERICFFKSEEYKVHHINFCFTLKRDHFALITLWDARWYRNFKSGLINDSQMAPLNFFRLCGKSFHCITWAWAKKGEKMAAFLLPKERS